MALYENVFIARQDVAQTQVEALTNQFAEIVTAAYAELAVRALHSAYGLDAV